MADDVKITADEKYPELEYLNFEEDKTHARYKDVLIAEYGTIRENDVVCLYLDEDLSRFFWAKWHDIHPIQENLKFDPDNPLPVGRDKNFSKKDFIDFCRLYVECIESRPEFIEALQAKQAGRPEL